MIQPVRKKEVEAPGGYGFVEAPEESNNNFFVTTFSSPEQTNIPDSEKASPKKLHKKTKKPEKRKDRDALKQSLEDALE